jgi:hypothetical protein
MAVLAADFSASGGFAQPITTKASARNTINDSEYFKCFITLFLLLILKWKMIALLKIVPPSSSVSPHSKVKSYTGITANDVPTLSYCIPEISINRGSRFGKVHPVFGTD